MEHGLDVRVLHLDGGELDAPVDVTFSGTRSLEPRRIEHAPGTLSFVAGEKPREKSSVELRSVSRRGIGTLDKAITVDALGYRMVGGADELVIDAFACDIAKPFTVKGNGITFKFVPDEADPQGGGTYNHSGKFPKFSLSGKGTYRVMLTDPGGSITAKGPGMAKTSVGTFTATHKEEYELTPMTCQQVRGGRGRQCKGSPRPSPQRFLGKCRLGRR